MRIVPGAIMVILKRVEPEEKVDRWYMVTVQPTLLEPVAVVCAYGEPADLLAANAHHSGHLVG